MSSSREFRESIEESILRYLKEDLLHGGVGAPPGYVSMDLFKAAIAEIKRCWVQFGVDEDDEDNAVTPTINGGGGGGQVARSLAGDDMPN